MASSACEAGASIEPSTPAEMLGQGPRPGVERSGTPGSKEHKNRARETGDSIDLGEGPAISNTDMRANNDAVRIMERLPPVYTGLG